MRPRHLSRMDAHIPLTVFFYTNDVLTISTGDGRGLLHILDEVKMCSIRGQVGWEEVVSANHGMGMLIPKTADVIW